ncbi:MAG: hypothetical protein RLZZ383_2655 [Pseudomonadota bacterium]
MSFRDQFLKAGLIDKKSAAKIDRAAKEDRKAAQAARDPKTASERARQAAAEAERERRVAQAAADRARAEAERVAHETVHRIKQVAMAHRMAGRGPVPFYHRRLDSPALACLSLRESLARDLRNGGAAIVGFRDLGGFVYVVVPRRTAERLVTFAPEAIVHWAPTPDHLSDPAESLHLRLWETTLRPRRVRDEEVAGLQARERARDEGRVG